MARLARVWEQSWIGETKRSEPKYHDKQFRFCSLTLVLYSRALSLSFSPHLFFLWCAFSFCCFFTLPYSLISLSPCFCFPFLSLYSFPPFLTLAYHELTTVYCKLKLHSELPGSCASSRFCVSSLVASWHGMEHTHNLFPKLSCSRNLSSHSWHLLPPFWEEHFSLRKPYCLWSPSVPFLLTLHAPAHIRPVRAFWLPNCSDWFIDGHTTQATPRRPTDPRMF